MGVCFPVSQYQSLSARDHNSIVSILNRIFHLFQVCLHPRPDPRAASQNSEEGEVDIRPGASEDS